MHFFKANMQCYHVTVYFPQQQVQVDMYTAEIDTLRKERETLAEQMQKAFMRGVCALNYEARTVFKDSPQHPLVAAQLASDAHGELSICDFLQSEVLLLHLTFFLKLLFVCALAITHSVSIISEN